MESEKIVILGAGGFGIALGCLLSKAGRPVALWSPFEEERALLLRERGNDKLLPGVRLPQDVSITGEMSAVRGAGAVILAVPSQAVRPVSRQLREHLGNELVVNVAKGLDHQSLSTLSQVIEGELGRRDLVALSGPSHAEEVARDIPTTVVAASHDSAAARRAQQLLTTPTFRIYQSDDLIGVEMGGALKNVIALAAGVCDGYGLGDNSKAALMTRGIVEIARLGTAMGARAETFAGLSGIGDLIVTCTSMHSRNRRAGILIGQGKAPADAIAEVGATVEGYATTESAYRLARERGVEMPITEEVYRILYEGKDLATSLASLMGRPQKRENADSH